MRRECAHCGSEEEMPFRCRYCGQPHCSHHRLPENHECRGLEDYKEQLREGGRLMAETPEVKVQREIRDDEPRRRSVSAPTEQLLQQFEGRTTWILIGAMVTVTVTGWIVQILTSWQTYVDWFALHPGSWAAPWTLVTSVFAHAPLRFNGIGHLLFNALVLFFFGPAVERRIGARAFLGLFLSAGIVAGLAQLGFAVALSETAFVLGASGAILAILGVLTVLEPDATVLLFFLFPMPLWILTGLIVVFNLVMLAFSPFGPIATLAHLVGLAIGVAAAKMFWKRSRQQMVEAWGM